MRGLHWAASRPPMRRSIRPFPGIACQPAFIRSTLATWINLWPNRLSFKNRPSYKRSSQARIGGALADGPRASRFATAHTREPAWLRGRWKSKRLRWSPGAPANTRRTCPSAMARTGRSKARRRRPVPLQDFFLKRSLVLARFNSDKSRPAPGSRSWATCSCAAMWLAAGSAKYLMTPTLS